MLEVVAGEQRHDGEALHRHPEVAADQRRQPVGLAVQRQRGALDLLVVLELHLEQPHHLDGEPGGAGDADAASTRRPGSTFSMSRWAMMLPIVARRSPAITTPPVNVAATIVVPCGTSSVAATGGGYAAGQQLGRVRAEEVGERGGARA